MFFLMHYDIQSKINVQPTMQLNAIRYHSTLLITIAGAGSPTQCNQHLLSLLKPSLPQPVKLYMLQTRTSSKNCSANGLSRTLFISFHGTEHGTQSTARSAVGGLNSASKRLTWAPAHIHTKDLADCAVCAYEWPEILFKLTWFATFLHVLTCFDMSSLCPYSDYQLPISKPTSISQTQS